MLRIMIESNIICKYFVIYAHSHRLLCTLVKCKSIFGCRMFKVSVKGVVSLIKIKISLSHINHCVVLSEIVSQAYFCETLFS